MNTAANGLYAGGGLIGSLCLHWLINKFGRRPIIQVLCVVAIISAILQGAAVHIAMFLVGRFINGLGVGAIDVAVPLYQSELSPAKQRGRMVGSHGFLVVCGYVSTSTRDVAVADGSGWRWLDWPLVLLCQRPLNSMESLPHITSCCPCPLTIWIALAS